MINYLTNLRIETSHIPVSLLLLSAELYVIVPQPARIVITDERIKNYLEEIKYEGSHTNWLNFRLISVTLAKNLKNVTEQGPISSTELFYS